MKVIVIGAGPSGLMSAISFASQGYEVLVLEQNKSAGHKLLLTGHGKCNFTHLTGVDEFLKCVVRNNAFLKTALYTFSSQKCVDFFQDLGVDSYAIEERVYPKSNKAKDILDALLNKCEELGVKFLYNAKVIKCFKEERFVVSLEHNELECDKLVIASGGKSYPQTGSNGIGYKIATEFGHTIVPIRSALCDIYLKDEFLKKLDGFTFEGATFISKTNNAKRKLTGTVIFKDNRISGNVVRNMSSLINREEVKELELDFKNNVSEEELDHLLVQKFSANPNREISRTLTAFVPFIISDTILSILKINKDLPCNAITKEMRKEMIRYLKHFPLHFLKFAPLEEAIVTSGGVDVKDINPKNMESKLVKDLYFVGEVLDVDAFVGGYSLQIAFATSYIVK